MGALMPVQKAAGAIGGSSAGIGFGGGIRGAVNAINPFQSGSGPGNTSNTRHTSSANSGGAGIPPSMAMPGPSGVPTASSPASQSGVSRTPSEGSGPHRAMPSPSESQMAGRGMNARGQSLGPTQAPGFVDPRFDPSATPGGGAKQSTNETGGTSANSFDVRSFQQRFEADYKQQPGGLADKLNSFSKRLQHAADRRKPHWVSDGHVGHAPGLRMGLDT
jgi:type IV secretion system protein TrbL